MIKDDMVLLSGHSKNEFQAPLGYWFTRFGYGFDNQSRSYVVKGSQRTARVGFGILRLTPSGPGQSSQGQSSYGSISQRFSQSQIWIRSKMVNTRST
ncbi:hypothetical protein HanIR_Chr02g0070931 [Helianthus annuus]|nr:hypothetical protein HanIR_Chr02g0070931 [Helianthus annuus]